MDISTVLFLGTAAPGDCMSPFVITDTLCGTTLTVSCTPGGC